MKVKEIRIEIGALRTIPKCLVKGLENSEIRRGMVTIQIKALLKSARVQRGVQET